MRKLLILALLVFLGCSSGKALKKRQTNCKSGRIVCASEVRDPQQVEDFLRRLPGVTIDGGRVIVRGVQPHYKIDGLLTKSYWGINPYDIAYVRSVTSQTEKAVAGSGVQELIEIVTKL